MNARTLVVIALAVMCGGAASVGVSRIAAQSGRTPKLETVPLPVAAIDVPRGTQLTEELVTMVDWPKSKVPESIVESSEAALGRTVIIPLLKGEPLLTPKLADGGTGKGVAPLIKPGMRAFTIMTPTLASGVAGLVLPGNRVDVLWTSTEGRADDEYTGGGTSVTLLQNIEVLAIDQQIEVSATASAESAGNANLRSVTLLVTEEHAKRLSLAQSKGTLSLALRNDGDLASTNSPIVTLNDIRWAQGRPDWADTPSVDKPLPPAENEGALTETVQYPEPIWVRIRTLRGISSGQVNLQLYGRAKVTEPPVPPADHQAKN